MLNSLPLIMVMVFTLFLAFYCVDSHKDNILTTVNMNKKNMTQVTLATELKAEENATKELVEVVETDKKVYVEVLAEEESKKADSKIVEESSVVEVEQLEPIKEPEPISETIEKVEVKKAVEESVTSEYSEGYKLDDLEKMIREELKKEKED